jgi:hypothetical protein
VSYLSNNHPSIHPRQHLLHCISAREKLNLATSKSRREKSLRRFHQQIVIVLHPSHLPTPSSPPSRQASRGCGAMGSSDATAYASHNFKKNHSEGKHETMKQGKEIWQTRKQETQNTRSRGETLRKSKPTVPSLNPPKSAACKCHAMLCFSLREIWKEDACARVQVTNLTD